MLVGSSRFDFAFDSSHFNISTLSTGVLPFGVYFSPLHRHRHELNVSNVSKTWSSMIHFDIFWTDKCCRFFWSKFSDGLQGSSWLQASGTWRTGCFLTQAWRRLKLSEKSKNAIYDFINLWHCIAKTWRQTLFNVAKAHCSQTSSFRVKMCKSWKNMEMRKAYKSNDKQQIVRGLRHRETFDVSSTCSCNPKTARSRRMSLAKIQYGCAETNWAFRSFKLSSEPWSFGEPVFGKLSTFLGRS